MRILFGILLVVWYAGVLYITRKEKRSFRSWFFEKLLVFRLEKRIFISSDNPEAYLRSHALANEQPYQFPSPLKLLCEVDRKLLAGLDCILLRHKVFEGTIVLYLHGGAYVEQPLVAHWLFLDQLIRLSGCKVVLPVYPKAPVHTATECIELLVELYRALIMIHNPEAVVLMGDSAGGGLALAMTQVLRDRGLPQPSRQILLSPWLDVSMENRGIDALESRDPMLQRSHLSVMGKAWAGDLDIHDPKVSPIHGSLKGLAPVTLYIGTHELFLADARRLKLRCIAQGVLCDYREFPKMNHVFPVFPIPEARRVQKEIACLLQPSSRCGFDSSMNKR